MTNASPVHNPADDYPPTRPNLATLLIAFALVLESFGRVSVSERPLVKMRTRAGDFGAWRAQPAQDRGGPSDHLIVFNADHLRRILAKYTTYYNEVRTHISLGKDAPYTRPI
jgi:hypothetical protein